MDEMKPEIINENPRSEIYLGDCLEIMKQIQDKSIDLVLTDPPYNVGKQFGGWNEGRIFDKEFHQEWLQEARRITKPCGGGIYMFWAGMSHLKSMIDTFGEFKQLIYWVKPFAMMVKNRRGYHCFTELIFWQVLSEDFYFNTAENHKDYFNTTSCMQRPQEHAHPTQKPLPIVKRLIMASSKQSDTILDPFMGSGTTGVAAKELGRNFIGIEIEPKYYEIAKRRIMNAQTLMFV
jgi:DNA modification methylase